MLTNVKSDDNVPLQPNRPRFNIVGVSPTTISQVMATGDFNGKRATTVGQPNPALLDPVVSGGKARWAALNNGGVFFLGGNQARPLRVETAYHVGCIPTYIIAAIDDPNLETAPTSLRPWPGTFPLRLSKNECLVVTTTTGTTNAELGFAVRLDGDRIL